MIITITILILIILVLLFALRQSNKRNQIYEAAVTSFYTNLTNTLMLMKIIDSKQLFESDDEVGEVFSQLNSIVMELLPIITVVDKQDLSESVDEET